MLNVKNKVTALLKVFILLIIIHSELYSQSINYAYTDYSLLKPSPAEQVKFNYEYDDETDSLRYVIERWQWGFNFGAYFANKSTANYYNGSETNTNTLKRAIMDTFYYTGNYNPVHKEIQEYLRSDFVIDEYPQDMKYQVALNLGFYAKYNFNTNLGIFGEFNYAKLKTSDVFTIELLNLPPGHLSPDKIKECYINGAEERFDINIGVCKTFGPPKPFKPYIDAAFNLNNTQVKEATAHIDDLSYSFLNQYNLYYNIREYGVGYGAILGGGLEINFNGDYLIYTGFNVSMKKINLGDKEAQRYRLHENFFIRFLFKKQTSSRIEA